MNSPVPVALIFDIGKTNKKWLVFDEDYHAISVEYFEVEQTQDKDGFPSENLQLLKEKMLQIVATVINHTAWDLKAINFTAYGATLVNTDKDNQLLHEVLNYLKPYPAGILKEFNNQYNNEHDLLLAETASPLLENLNTALQLYALKKTDPAVFEKIHHATFLPQYLSSMFTGTYSAEYTSIGCHTLSWDFSKSDYHDWIKKEGIDLKFPPIQPTNKPLSVVYENKNCHIGIGIHDSSSALLPYRMNIKEPFMLLSTGSWSICLNPFNHSPLSRSALKQDCLAYMGIDGKPVKASRLNAGFMHEEMLARLCSHFQNEKEQYLNMEFELEILHRVEASKIEKTTYGAFEPSAWNSYQEAYTAAMLAIVEAQIEKINLVSCDEVKQLYVDGGFSKNKVFMHLLKHRLPQYQLYAAEVGQSTALGAALVLHTSWNSTNLRKNLLSLKAI